MKKSYPSYVQAAGLLLLILPFSALGIIILMVFHLAEDTYSLTIVYSVGLGLTVYFGMRGRKKYSFEWTPFPLSLLLVTLTFILSFHFIMEPLVSLLPEPEGLINVMTDLMRYPLLAFLTISLVGPILEELLFRGVILDGFLKNYSPLMSALVSGFLFALVHGNLTQGIGAFFMGVVVALLYWRVRSISFCIVLHMLINFIACVSMFYTAPENVTKSTRDMIGNDPLYYTLYVSFFLLFVSCGWYLWLTYIRPVQSLLTLKPIASEGVNV